MIRAIKNEGDWLFFHPCAEDPTCQIIPNNDTRDHVVGGFGCWCEPYIEINDPETKEKLPYPVVMHYSHDGREAIEHELDNQGGICH